MSNNSDYTPVWKQEVRNERGGKRLHGAFTGGFSAGYYNTVGSKEGWQPSQFKSSKKFKSEAPDMSTPDFFMDEEDKKEFTDSITFRVKEGSNILSYADLDLKDQTIKAVSFYEQLHESNSFTQFEVLDLNLDEHSSIEVPTDFIPKGLRGLFPIASIERKSQKVISKFDYQFIDEEAGTSVTDDNITKDSAILALKGFIPFQEIPLKQNQYLSYLKYHAGLNDNCPHIDPQWKLEFKSAAKIFKPLPEMMSKKFVSASNLSATDSSAGKNVATVEVSKPIKINGRTVIDWIPSSTLCEKFKVAPPIKNKASAKEQSGLNMLRELPIDNNSYRRPELSIFNKIFGD